MTAARWRLAVAAVAALALSTTTWAAPAGADMDALAGGTAGGRGLFVTYTDHDTVIEGGTVAPPDFAAPTAQAAIDFTGLGSALAALGYSPYSDAAGVLNAFGGTELPLGQLGEKSRAKVNGRPPQEQVVSLSDSAGFASARLADGPTADARTSLAAFGNGDVTAQLGTLQATVSVQRTADSKVTVVLRAVRIGELRIDTITLSAAALADGGAGKAAASALVEGVTLAGQAVRLTPKGLEPIGAGPPDLAPLAAAGIEVVSAGEAAAEPGGQQSEARATGPRLRIRTPDGRLLTVVLGEAVATSTWQPPQSER